MIKGVQTRVDSEIHPVALIENAEAIQAALMHMIDAVLKGTLDNKRANIVLKALHIAVRNSRNVRFSLHPDDMVREVPNYAQQYLTEHPELKPPQPTRQATPDVAPDAPVREAEQGSAASNKNGHPERARTSRESNDPRAANSRNTPAGNSPNPSEGNREIASTDTTSPLPNHPEYCEEIKKLEASIEGAMHGNWRDLRTVFNAVGLTPHKPPASDKPVPRKKVIRG
jgi:type IV secretory pathway VirB10-like protein